MTPKQPWISRIASVTSSAQQVLFKVLLDDSLMTFEGFLMTIENHLNIIYTTVCQIICTIYRFDLTHCLIWILLIGPATDQEIAADRFGFLSKETDHSV